MSTLILFNCRERASLLVDDALKSATEAQEKTSNEADEKFQRASDNIQRQQYLKGALYESASVDRMMERAKAMDKSASTILNRLREKWRVREELQVTFLRHKLIPIPSHPQKWGRYRSSSSFTGPFLTTVQSL